MASRIVPTVLIDIASANARRNALMQQYPRHSGIVENLKRMSKADVEHIYSFISEHFLQKMVYYELFTYDERTIIYVVSIDIDGITTQINMGFYKSTGTSRSTGLNDIWLPTTYIQQGWGVGHIGKPEDPYILKYEVPAGVRNIEEEEELITYRRFINKPYALVSFFLSHYPNLKVDKIITSLEVSNFIQIHNEIFKRYSDSDKLVYTEYITSEKLKPKSIKGQMPV
jgi:hypothetical protein